MKFVIKEGKTIRVNEELLKYVVEQYRRVFVEYKKTLNGTAVFNGKHDEEYFERLAEFARVHFIFENKPLSEILDLDYDPILSRYFASQASLEQKLNSMPNAKLTLAFWIDHPTKHKNINDFAGFFDEIFNKHPNTIRIKFPYKQAAFMPGIFEKMKPTIRHELQHFTQSFYASVLGLKHWIGLPTKKLTKNKNQFGTGEEHEKHYDIPVEISTDVQDEIEDFLAEYRYANFDEIKKGVIDYVGIGDPAYASPVFRHYFETNKGIWKWAVSKLLSAVKAM